MNKRVIGLIVLAIIAIAIAILTLFRSKKQLNSAMMGDESLLPSPATISEYQTDQSEAIATPVDALQNNLDDLIDDEDLANLYDEGEAFGFTGQLP